MCRGFEVNFAEPVTMSFILATIAVIVVVTAIGIVLVKKHPKASKER
jgi:hypothetical protein